MRSLNPEAAFPAADIKLAISTGRVGRSSLLRDNNSKICCAGLDSALVPVVPMIFCIRKERKRERRIEYHLVQLKQSAKWV